MSSHVSSTRRREGDEWTMVDRVSELLENGAMSDISLPPLPPFGVSPSDVGSGSSSSSSSSSESEGGGGDDDLVGGGDAEGSSIEEGSWEYEQEEQQQQQQQQHRQQLYFSRPESGNRNTSIGEEGAAHAVASPNRARAAAGAGRRRRSTATGGGVGGSNVRRRPAGRSGREAALSGDSSPSVSPARPRRRGGGRTERNGRRADEGPPALQSASEPSLSDASTSFTSSEESSDEPHRRQPLPGFRGGGVSGSGPRTGGRSSDGGDSDGGGGRRGGGSELVPFSLSEIACVPSETVSEVTGSSASSPFRVQDGAGEGGDGGRPSRKLRSSSSRRFSGSSTRSVSKPASLSAAAPAAAAEETAAVVAAVAAVAAAAASATAATQVVEAGTGGGNLRTDSHKYHLTPSAVARRRINSSESSGTSSRGSSLGGATGDAGGPVTAATGGEAHAGSDARRTNTPLMLAFGLRDINDDTTSSSSSNNNNTNTNNANVVGYDDGEQSKRAPPPPSAAGTSCTTPSYSPAASGSGSGSGGAWSSSVSSARGLTPSSLVPLGPLLDWEGGNNTGGGGGGGGVGGTSMSASLAGFAGYRSALLEARRAAVAEDQVEFWQRRACAAEKVVAEQKMKITELLRRCATASPPSATSSPDAAGCSKKATPSHSLSVRSEIAVEEEKEQPEQRQLQEEQLQRQQQQQPQQRNGGAGRGRVGTVEDETLEDCGGSAAAAAAAATMKGEEQGVNAALAAIGGIAFTSFSVGQVSMFFPTPDGNFLAFNVGCPGHFLSKESQALVGKDEHFRTYYVLGRIIEIQDEACGKENPYKLPVGQCIKVVYVESITPDLQAAGVIPSK